MSISGSFMDVFVKNFKRKHFRIIPFFTYLCNASKYINEDLLLLRQFVVHFTTFGLLEFLLNIFKNKDKRNKDKNQKCATP